jgi:hypothetical protein
MRQKCAAIFLTYGKKKPVKWSQVDIQEKHKEPEQNRNQKWGEEVLIRVDTLTLPMV